MGLDVLPPEIVAHICSYLCDVYDLSLTNHYLRSICSRLLFRSLSASYPSQRLNEVLDFAQSSNGAAVQDLIITYPRYGRSSRSGHSRDQFTTKRLADRILAFKCLKRLTCAKTVLALLSEDELRSLDRLRLGVTNFGYMGTSENPKISSITKSARILNMTNLVSLECWVPLLAARSPNLLDFMEELNLQDEEEEEEEEEADEFAIDKENITTLMIRQGSKYTGQALCFISSVWPQLEALKLTSTPVHDGFILPQFQIHKLSLTRLDLFLARSLHSAFFRLLRKLCHLELLQALSLPAMSEDTLKWVANHSASLRSLKEFGLRTESEPNYTDRIRRRVDMLLKALPPLKRLTILGYGSLTFSYDILERHATLESLRLQDTSELGRVFYTNGNKTLTLLTKVLQLPCLQYLCIYVNRCAEIDSVLWDTLRSSSVKNLTLVMVCSLLGSHETVKDKFKRFALDENLAKSIFETCDLEELHVMTVENEHDGQRNRSYYRREHDLDGETTDAIIRQLQGSYKCRRRGGQIQILDVIDKLLRSSEGAKAWPHTPSMREFREVWPSKGGDWQTEWYSMPIVLEDTTSS